MDGHLHLCGPSCDFDNLLDFHYVFKKLRFRQKSTIRPTRVRPHKNSVQPSFHRQSMDPGLYLVLFTTIIPIYLILSEVFSMPARESKRNQPLERDPDFTAAEGAFLSDLCRSRNLGKNSRSRARIYFINT